MSKTRPTFSSNKSIWLYGLHAVNAALNNPLRQKTRLLIKSEKMRDALPSIPSHMHIEIVDKQIFQNLFGLDAVHQGIALQTSDLPELSIEECVAELSENVLLIILDEVTDPHNVGAILRSAAAFGATAIVSTARHAPTTESAILAKTASGALEEIPLIRITNLARTLQYLKEQNFWIYGFDERGQQSVSTLKLSGKLAFVFGAEGEGIRRLTRETCDELIYLPTQSKFGTLNVSTSAAVALYEWRRQNPIPPLT